MLRRLVPILVIIIFSSSAFAQLPSARLTAIYPSGGKAGSTIDATFTGADLDDAAEIRFSSPGITGKPQDSADSETDRKFNVSISPDVAPGVYEARIVSRFGISNSRAFTVGTLPEILAPAKSDSAPPSIPIDTIINGHCTANSIDTYSVDLKQGQRVLIECVSRQIDSRLVPAMVLGSSTGNELARSRRGGMIDFTAPADGTYILQLHDLLYKGGPEYFYRLCVSTGPHLDSIFPPAGLPGSKEKCTLLGRNLPGGKITNLRAADGRPLEQLDVEISLPDDASASPKPDTLALLGPAGAGIDGFAYRLKSDKGPSNPVLIGFARAPLVVAPSATGSSDNAAKLSEPCEVVGRFYPHGHRDVFTFDADKDSVYWIEILSARMGQPTSPELLVQRVGKSDKGTEQLSDIQDLGGPDMQPMGKRGGGASAGFPAQTRDIEYRLESKEPGTYRLTISDLFDETDDNAALVYRMLIHKQSPDFRVIATTVPPQTKDNQNPIREPSISQPFLRKGGATAIRVNVLREGGFDGEVTVEAQGLPDSIHCASAKIAGDDNATNLVLSTDENPKPWTGDVRIVAKATVDGKETTHQARIGTIVWSTLNPGNNNQERGVARLSSDMPLAISADESEPITLTLDKPTHSAKADQKIQIALKVNRHIELKQPIKIYVAGLPRQGNNGKPDLTIDTGADTGTIDLDLAPQRLTPGTYTFYLQAQAQIKYDRQAGITEKPDAGAKGKKREAKDSLVMFYSPPITLTILPK